MSSLSQKIGTSFPYDWSSPDMSSEVFVRQVFKRGLFRDMLKTVKYFGIQKTSKALEGIEEELSENTLDSYRDILKGYENAQKRMPSYGNS